MRTLNFHTKQFQIPSTLNEINGQQLSKIMHIVSTITDDQKAAWLIVLTILNVRKRLWLKWFFFVNEYWKPFLGNTLGFNVTAFQMDEIDMEEVLKVSDFLYSTESQLTQNLFPVVKTRLFQKLVGPENQLRNLLFRQYRYADTRFLMYVKTNETKYLHDLIATIYARPHERYDLPDFNEENRQSRRQKIAAQLPTATKLCILLFYQGCRQSLIDKHANIFPKPKSADPDAKPKEHTLTYREILKNNETFEAVLLRYAKNPVELQIIDTAPVWDVFKKLDADLLNDRKEREALARINRKN